MVCFLANANSALSAPDAQQMLHPSLQTSDLESYQSRCISRGCWCPRCRRAAWTLSVPAQAAQGTMAPQAALAAGPAARRGDQRNAHAGAWKHCRPAALPGLSRLPAAHDRKQLHSKATVFCQQRPPSEWHHAWVLRTPFADFTVFGACWRRQGPAGQPTSRV